MQSAQSKDMLCVHCWTTSYHHRGIQCVLGIDGEIRIKMLLPKKLQVTEQILAS